MFFPNILSSVVLVWGKTTFYVPWNNKNYWSQTGSHSSGHEWEGCEPSSTGDDKHQAAPEHRGDWETEQREGKTTATTQGSGESIEKWIIKLQQQLKEVVSL